jgi:hypothetical protein
MFLLSFFRSLQELQPLIASLLCGTLAQHGTMHLLCRFGESAASDLLTSCCWCAFCLLLQELQPLIASLLRGTLAQQLAAQKAAQEQQRQERQAAMEAARLAIGDGDSADWGSGGGSGGEEAMM